MARKLKVYRWQGFRSECPATANGLSQTEEIMAASSMAEVYSLVGRTRSHFFNIGETGNKEQVRVAMAEPRVVFWKPIDGREGYTRSGDKP